MKKVHLFISGRVQGVFYRYTAQEVAHRLRLKGWVRNRFNGQVEAVAEGDDDKIEEFVRWCHEGPPGAAVTKVDVAYEDPLNEFNSFSIKSTA